jgi:hypothetical protein
VQQEIQAELMKRGFVHLRSQFCLSWREIFAWLFSRPRRWQYSQDLANLLHRIGESILEPSLTDLDVSFINHAIPCFLEKPANRWDRRLMQLLVQFHDAAMQERASEITWHPCDSGISPSNLQDQSR